MPADGRSTATLVAYLADFDGNPLPNEIVRFTIVQGTGTLEETELGTDVGVDRLAVLNSRANRLSRSAPLTAQAVQATSLGDGRYVARYQAGTTGEPVIIEAAWVSTAQTALPAAQLVIDLRSPAALSVFVDDDSLPALGGEEATIIAYLEDGDGRPVDGARVTFNVIAGTGEIIPASELGIAQSGGRYAAVYRAGGTAGVTTIQVSVVDADVLLSETVQIELREVNRLEALAFPNVVQRLGGATSSSFERPIRLENTATIVVAVRDSDGDLVRGLGPRDLIAEVATGPGSVTNMSEIASPTGEGTGVYYTTYVASRAEDMATVLMTNLAATGNPQASVQVQTVSTIGSTGGIASDLFLVAFTDDLYDAGSSSPPSLLTALVSNSDGNPVDGLVPDVTVLQGVGATSREMVELPNLATGGGSGVYVAGYLAASVATTQDTTVRARAQSLNGPTVIADQIITIDPVLEPIAVVFPPLLPGDASSLATIDVFNLNDIVPDDLRYQVNITGGTGRILFQPNNSGENGDLIAGDLIATGVYQAGAGSIVTSLEVTDTDAAGLPAVLADVSVGAPTTLTVFAFPGLARLSQSIALDIFATDQFGNSLSGHTIRVDVVRGSALVSNGGLAVDDGLGVGLVQDAYANDGVYVAEVITSSVVAGPVLLRITDTTDRLQPVVEVTADVF
ncbi:MAG: hypothetical protein HY335_08320 [Deinococcus sp.]|nr:hypothetical protein [Deinococcus sp.]